MLLTPSNYVSNGGDIYNSEHEVLDRIVDDENVNLALEPYS